MPFKKIVLASVLKPVDDTRMYEKLGVSLVETNKYEINIIGFSTKNAANPDPIVWNPIFDFKRNHWKRLFAPYRFFRKLIKVKPQVIITNTPELLGVIFLYKILFGAQVIYDVIENYRNNIRYTQTYPRWIRPILILITRLTERISRLWVDFYFVAEKSYIDELRFLGNNHVLLENKYKDLTLVATVKANPGKRSRLIYSGTIARHYGIFEAISLTEVLHEIDPDVFLTIIGFAPDTSIMQEIQEMIKDKPYFEIIGGDVLVPHQQLIDAMAQSHIGLVPYRPNKSTFNCVPTKIYEYMAHQLPIVLQKNELWETLCENYQAGIAINFDAYDPKKLWETCQQKSFYSPEQPMDIYWSSEEEKLLQTVDTILK